MTFDITQAIHHLHRAGGISNAAHVREANFLRLRPALADFALPIHVTDRDIQDGWARDCHECPVAFAVRRALEEAGHKVLSVAVTSERVYVVFHHADDGRFVRATALLWDEHTRDFVQIFDNALEARMPMAYRETLSFHFFSELGHRAHERLAYQAAKAQRLNG